MAPILGYAQRTDLSGSQWYVVLVGLAAIALAAGLALVPIALARRRFHRQAEVITIVALLWGLLAAGSVIYFYQAESQWQQDYDTNIKTGYYDPQDTSGAPAAPWPLWFGLVAGYAALVAYSSSRKNPPPSESP